MWHSPRPTRPSSGRIRSPAAGQPDTAKKLAEYPAEPVPQPPRAALDGTASLAHRLLHVVADVLPRGTMEAALLLRLRADEERRASHLRAVAGRQLAGCGIHVAPHDVVGHREAALGIGPRRRLDEVGPDRERRLRAGHAEARVAVEPDPHARHDVGRVADEPCVALLVGGARLARGGALEPR